MNLGLKKATTLGSNTESNKNSLVIEYSEVSNSRPIDKMYRTMKSVTMGMIQENI